VFYPAEASFKEKAGGGGYGSSRVYDFNFFSPANRAFEIVFTAARTIRYVD